MLVYVVHKTQTDRAFSRLSRAKTGKKFTKKKRDACAKLFLLFKLIVWVFFDVLVAVSVVGS